MRALPDGLDNGRDLVRRPRLVESSRLLRVGERDKFSNVHCAVATENVLVLENHSVDIPWWNDLVDGIEKPIVNRGSVTVADKPGPGITLNEDVPGYFAPTPKWDKERPHDRLWS